MQKIKRLSFKYSENNDDYILIKIQNVEGLKPKQTFKDLKQFQNTDIEIVVK